MAKKHMETLDALLQAYEARLKPLETLEERWRQYPDPELETRRLEMYKRLVETTQALMQQMKPNHTSEKETPNVKNQVLPETLTQNEEPDLQEEIEQQEIEKETKTILIPSSTVPEVDEEWGNALWDAVKQTQKETERKSRPPIEEIDFDQKTLELEFKSQYGEEGSEKWNLVRQRQ